MAGPVEVISHWHHSIEEFNTSALEFYRSVEEALRAKEAPSVRLERVDWNEGGVLSAKREYLRISHGRFSFDLCAAPFGRDYFFSWWLVRRQPDGAFLFGCLGLLALPILLLISMKVAGFFGGLFLFLIICGAALAWVSNAARSGSEAVEDALLAIPGIGTLYTRFIKPVTYYSTDTRVAFEESVHRVVLKHVEALRTLNNLPALLPVEAKSKSRAPLS